MHDAESALWQRRHAALFAARLSALYHRKRERHFDLLDKAIKAATVVAGASLLAPALRDHAPALGAAVSALGLVALVYSLSDRKQAHKALADKFLALQAAIERAGHDPSPDQCSEWEAQIALLNGQEPPSLGALVVLCQNELAIADGHPGSVVPVRRAARWLANWADLRWA